MSYILVLTLILVNAGSYRHSSMASTIQQVGPFASQQECLAAGNQWLRQQRSIKYVVVRMDATAMCVATSAGKK